MIGLYIWNKNLLCFLVKKEKLLKWLLKGLEIITEPRRNCNISNFWILHLVVENNNYWSVCLTNIKLSQSLIPNLNFNCNLYCLAHLHKFWTFNHWIFDKCGFISWVQSVTNFTVTSIIFRKCPYSDSLFYKFTSKKNKSTQLKQLMNALYSKRSGDFSRLLRLQ